LGNLSTRKHPRNAEFNDELEGDGDYGRLKNTVSLLVFSQPAAGLAKGYRLLSRFGDSHGFIARKPWR